MVLSLITSEWKEDKSPSSRIKKNMVKFIVKYYAVVKKLQLHSTTWMTFRNIIMSQRGQA